MKGGTHESKAISRAFLRTYAQNLRRGWRDSPETAKSDAVYTVEFLILFPLAVWSPLLYAILTKVFPNSIGRLDLRVPEAVAVAAFIGSWLWLERRLNNIEVSSELLHRFSTAAERIKILYLYAINVGSVLLVGYGGYLFHGR